MLQRWTFWFLLSTGFRNIESFDVMFNMNGFLGLRHGTISFHCNNRSTGSYCLNILMVNLNESLCDKTHVTALDDNKTAWLAYLICSPRIRLLSLPCVNGDDKPPCHRDLQREHSDTQLFVFDLAWLECDVFGFLFPFENISSEIFI